MVTGDEAPIEKKAGRSSALGGIDEWDGKDLPPRKEVGMKKYALLIADRYVIPTMLLLLLGLLLFIAPTIVLFAVVVLAMVSPCILLHEAGHYWVARRAGLGVEEFSLGMGKRVWSRVSKKTGVRWSVKSLPIGGSVAVAGMTVEEVEEKDVPHERAFIYASIWTRLRVALSGVAVNLLLALVTFCVLSVIVTAPEYGIWKALLLSPLSAVFIFVTLVIQTVGALLGALSTLGFGGEVSSLLSMPQVVHGGLQEATSAGASPFVYYGMVFAGLNISLAVLNALPFYILDGGHALVAVIDGVRKVRARRENRVEKFSPLRASRLAIYNKVTGFTLIAFIAVVYTKDLIRMLFDNT